jgi:hypothetical protein
MPMPHTADMLCGSFNRHGQMIGRRLPERSDHIRVFQIKHSLPPWPRPSYDKLIMIQPA